MHNIGLVLKDGEGAQIHFRGTKITVKVSKEDSDGKYTILEMVHPPDIGHALHIHPNAPEAYYAYYVLDDEYLLKPTTYWKASIESDVVKNSIMHSEEILCLFQEV